MALVFDPTIAEAVIPGERKIYIGQQIRLDAEFYSDDDETTPADPTTISFKVMKTDETQTTYTYAGATVLRLAVGAYRVLVTVDQAGWWRLRVEGAGAVSAVNVMQFEVLDDGF